ncbi:MAG: tripartite tricarboxylate transporter substrate binding protein [Proteobacteria bacterium]|nr:tripartite tricarboxylate transporter substrate binding protein [Pseudomonadota bacterium]
MPQSPADLRRRLLLSAGLAAATAAARPVFAQAPWPAQPVRLVVNFPPGSSPDVLARMVATPLQQALGQPVVVENRAGASGMIGAEAVAKAAPDGYTLLMTAGSAITTNPFIYARMPYDAERDLTPVAALARLTLTLVVRADLPARDVREFIAYLKANPGKVSYGSAGNATGLHLAGEMLKSQAGVYAVHVPYRGASLALQDLLGGQIDFYFDPGIAVQHVRSGRLRVLAIGGTRRSTTYPGVPTLEEAGLPGFDAGTTHGIYAPARTPPEVVGRLHREINRILSTPAVRAQIDGLGAEATPMSLEQFATVMKDDGRRYAEVIRRQGIKAD